MTTEEASKLNCPYKPYKTTLDGIPVPTCNPIGCMCWVSIVKTKYVNKILLKYGECFDTEKYPMHEYCTHERLYKPSVDVYGIPTKVEKSYCTLRGKDV